MDDVMKRAKALVEKIREDGGDYADEDIEFVDEQLKCGASYYNSVIGARISTEIAYVRFADEPERIKDTIENLDHTRRLEHQTLTRSINILNRMAKIHGVEPVYDIGDRMLDDENKEDRDFAAVLAYRFTNGVYLDEMVRSNYFVKENTFQAVDDALYKMEQDSMHFNLGTDFSEVVEKKEIAHDGKDRSRAEDPDR